MGTASVGGCRVATHPLEVSLHLGRRHHRLDGCALGGSDVGFVVELAEDPLEQVFHGD